MAPAAEMDFQQMLRRLGDEHRRLEQERDALSDEVSRLRQRLGQKAWDQAGRCPADAAAPLPGQVDGDGGAEDQAAPARKRSEELEAKRQSAQDVGGAAPARRSSRHQTVGEGEWLDDREQMNRARQKARFLEVFGLDASQQHTFRVTARNLGQVLAKRGLRNVKESFLEEAFKELARLSQARARNVVDDPPTRSLSFSNILPGRISSAHDSPRADAGMGFEAFVDAVLRPDLPKRVEPRLSRGIEKMQEALLKQDVDEIIAKLSRTRESKMDMPVDGDENKTPRWKSSMDTALGVVVTLTVLASIFCLGLSRETDPDWGGWLALEALFVAIFIAEIVLKILMHGWRCFWCGKDRQWNWLDATVTVIAVADVFLNVAFENLADEFKFSRLALVGRAFRLFRLGRVLTMMRSPLIRELSNMLIGFVLGSPALLWVTMIIWVVVGLLAMSLRIAVGPRPDDEVLLAKCGSGDSPTFTVDQDPDCAKHKLYAEEYCGSLSKCMFTVFRCMIGDCSSSGGQSLAGHFSEGFGTRFDIVYLTGMIVMIFGLFNVITAIFVEATMAGLKYNEAKQKLRNVYEHQYVKRKLEELVKRIQAVSHQIQKGKRDRQSDGKGSDDLASAVQSWTGSDVLMSMSEDPDDVDNINLTEDEFFVVIEDSTVGRILTELDIEIEGAGKEALFDIMDSNYSGTVDVASIIDTLMKLRGGPMKVDMIAPSVALRGLQQELRRLSSRLTGPAAADPAGGGGDAKASQSPSELAGLEA